MGLHPSTESSVCLVCSTPTAAVLTLSVFGRDRELHQCPSCEAAYYPEVDWLGEAYSTAISAYDTGIVERCFDIANVLTAFMLGRSRDRVVDFGGGIGLLARIMRDRGFNFFSWDPMADYRLPLPTTDRDSSDMVTMIEVLEHLQRPMLECEQLSNRSRLIFISTHLIPKEGLHKEWSYLQPESGQHIFFCTRRTLNVMASTMGMEVTSNGKNLHVFSSRRLTRWERLVIRFQQPAWVFGLLMSMPLRRKSLAMKDQAEMESTSDVRSLADYQINLQVVRHAPTDGAHVEEKP